MSRMEHGLFWPTEDEPAPEPTWVKVTNAVLIAGSIIVAVALVGWMHYQDQKVLVVLEEARAERYAKMLADCLSGKVLWDKANNTALFCDKAITVSNPRWTASASLCRTAPLHSIASRPRSSGLMPSAERLNER